MLNYTMVSKSLILKELPFHISLAHKLWADFLSPEDTAIDATCGNGHDAAFLAPLISALSVYDIQESALKNTKNKLTDSACQINFNLRSHTDFIEKTANLIIYNLGYLPSGNKEITTQTTSTIVSVEKALSILAPKGAISITCYPGHTEGKKEETAVVKLANNLDPNLWKAYWHKQINNPIAPSLLWIEKIKNQENGKFLHSPKNSLN